MSFLTEVKHYAELTPDELGEVCQFRNRIYLAEGRLTEGSTEIEFPHLPDTTDADSVHFIIRNQQQEIVAYSRLVFSKTPPEVSRFCVHDDYRGHTTEAEPIVLLFAIMTKYSLTHQILHWQCIIDGEFFYLCKRILNMAIKKIGDKCFYMGGYCYPCEVNLMATLRQNHTNPRGRVVLEMLTGD
jgi:predicted GNAT family N-acyltransferase